MPVPGGDHTPASPSFGVSGSVSARSACLRRWARVIIRAMIRSPRWTVSLSSAEYVGDARSAVVWRSVGGLRLLVLLIPLSLWLGLSWAKSLPSSVSGRESLHIYLWDRSQERP